MPQFSIHVNGQAHRFDAQPDTPLLYVLRDHLEMNNPRFGCGLGQCGACTVLADGEAIRSCQVPVKTVNGHSFTTLDGLGTPDSPDPVQEAFVEEQAMQCGYCMNGWILTTKALLAKNANPTDQEIRDALSSLVCRCGSHTSVFRAVKSASAKIRGV